MGTEMQGGVEPQNQTLADGDRQLSLLFRLLRGASGVVRAFFFRGLPMCRSSVKTLT